MKTPYWWFELLFAFIMGLLYYFAGRLTQVRDRLAPKERAPAGAPGFFNLGMAFLLVLPLICLLSRTTDQTEMGARILRDLLTVTCIYSVLLLMLLPMLRRVAEPRACAVLWVIPPFTYYAFYRLVPPPIWVIRLPKGFPWLASVIWGIGAALVFGVQLARHIHFRNRMVKNARPIEGAHILELWRQEEACFFSAPKESLKLLWCPAAPCPMALGLWSKRVLLPPGIYSDDDLRLIFRHELCHLKQSDISNKFTLSVLRALCWFNPLMWLGIRQASNDLERACDEVALLGASDTQRRRYGTLLLSSAAGGTGFSTCLSCGAKPLAIRLQNILHPKKRLVGGIFLGLACLSVFLLMGKVQYSTKYGSAEALIFEPFEQGGSFRISQPVSSDAMPANDRKQIEAYLRGLDVAAFYRGRSFDYEDKNSYTLFLYHDESELGYIQLTGQYLLACRYEEREETEVFPPPTVYFVEGGLDWTYLNAVVKGNGGT